MLPKLFDSTLFSAIRQFTDGLTGVNTNTQPIIGVVSQALYDPLDKDPKFAKYKSFVEAGYVMHL